MNALRRPQIMRAMKSLAAVALGFWLVACGGGTPEANAPDSSDELYEDDPVEQNFAGADSAGVDEPAAGGSDDDESDPSGPASAEDLQQILQLVINDEALDPILKLAEPGRFPLQISGEDIPSGVELMKNTEPVKVVPPPKSKQEPVLVFTSIDADSKQARVRYRYDVEGVRGSASLKKLEGRWQLSNSRVSDYGGGLKEEAEE